MKYRKDKYGNELSILGYGCMRFSRKVGMVDIKKTEKEIMTAFNNGVNYYDTAYIYPGSEAALGKIVEKNGIRDNIYIATKLPHYMIKSRNPNFFFRNLILDSFFAESQRNNLKNQSFCNSLVFGVFWVAKSRKMQYIICGEFLAKIKNNPKRRYLL